MKNLQEAHDKSNEAYTTTKAELFSRKSKKLTDELNSLANDRLNKLNETIAGISDFGNSYVEAVDTFVSFFDDVILECAELTSRRAEVEEKIIGLCKNAMEKPTAENKRNEKEEHVTAKIVDCITKEMPPPLISATMAAALLDNTNPLRLGLTFYEAFCEKNPLFADTKALYYLKTEAEVRASLIKGDDEQAFAALEKMMASPIECPEKFLLFALNSFYCGLENDAVRALDIGIGKFPGNERLLSAKSALA
jgi:hypothetical protein